MKNILIHGLGQNHKSWNETIKFLEIDNIDVLCPALFKMSSGNSNDYQNIFSSFSDFCNNQEGKLNLCGLSLGGILALDYVKKYPEKVNSMSNHNIKNGLNKINCKSLVLCRSKDKANMKSAKQISQSIRKSEFKIVKDSSHEVNVDNPKELAHIIYDFWKEFL